MSLRRFFVVAFAAASPALAEAPAPAVPTFATETETAGLTHSFTGEWEFMVGGGAAAFDCNNDALLDLYVAGGTSASDIFINKSAPGASLSFVKGDGVPALDWVSGAYPADIDSDGKTDLIVLRVGENVVLRGLGECRFERANEAWGFDGGDAWSTALAATWEKGANWPSVAIGNYIDRKEEAFPWGSCTDNWLHRPNTEGTGFAAPLPLKPSFCALSMLFTDWNRSGTPALRISNDREYYKGGQEQLWHMDPGAEPRLYTPDEGWQRLRIWGMGIASHDLNFDGYPEYFLTSMSDNKLQTLAEVPADGKPVPKYADVAFKKGAVAYRPYTGGDLRPSTAWHTQIEDVNNDGLADIFIAKGNVWEMPDFAQQDPNNLLLQREDGTFEEAGDRAGVASMLTARGGAVADFNNDGLLDLMVVNRNGPTEIWRNTSTGLGGWIAVTPKQNGPNRDAIGAWVEVRTGDKVQRREVTVGGGHAGGVLAPQHFGIGAAATADVRVIWPDGTTSEWQSVAPNTALTVARP